jgi:hypothetical protein
VFPCITISADWFFMVMDWIKQLHLKLEDQETCSKSDTETGGQKMRQRYREIDWETQIKNTKSMTDRQRDTDKKYKECNRRTDRYKVYKTGWTTFLWWMNMKFLSANVSQVSLVFFASMSHKIMSIKDYKIYLSLQKACSVWGYN